MLTASTICIFGCKYFPESTFSLANDSRLPKWVVLPNGLERKDVQLTLSYYIKPWGRSAVFALEDQKKNELQKATGKLNCAEPLRLKAALKSSDANYPAYEAVSVNGVTEIIEHRKMEPIFYVTDDPALRTEYLAIGCGQTLGDKR